MQDRSTIRPPAGAAGAAGVAVVGGSGIDTTRGGGAEGEGSDVGKGGQRQQSPDRLMTPTSSTHPFGVPALALDISLRDGSAGEVTSLNPQPSTLNPNLLEGLFRG